MYMEEASYLNSLGFPPCETEVLSSVLYRARVVTTQWKVSGSLFDIQEGLQPFLSCLSQSF